MKNLYKAALLAALGLGSTVAAQASTTDFLLGFNDAAGASANQNDYVIDLGVTSLTSSQFMDFSSLFNATTFSQAFGTDGTLANHVSVGVVEGLAGTTYPKTLFTTGNPTSLSSAPSSGNFNNSVAAAGSPTIGEYASTSTASWTSIVAGSPTLAPTASPNMNGTGNPLSYLSSGSVSETLWEATKGSSLGTPTAWVDIGTFFINASTGTITFTGANYSPVPEPATYGALAGAGLLALSLRRQFSRKNA